LKLLAGESIPVEAGGKTLQLLPEEIEVRMQAKEGYSVAAEGAYLAALVTDLTPELVNEGLAREFVRRVQDLRKSMDLNISDRIHLNYTASPALQGAVEAFRDYIMLETLALTLAIGDPIAEATTIEDEFDLEKVKVSIRKA